MGNTYNLKAIPYGVMIDEVGRLVKPPFNINVDNKETVEMLEKWLYQPNYNTTLLQEITPVDKSQNPNIIEANARFKLGILLLDIGKQSEAIVEWRKALALDPNNWIIHKQIWAVEHPDKFYEGNVDYRWQKRQLNAENNP